MGIKNEPVTIMVSLELFTDLVDLARVVSEDHSSLVKEHFKAHDAATHRRLNRELRAPLELLECVKKLEENL